MQGDELALYICNRIKFLVLMKLFSPVRGREYKRVEKYAYLEDS
jgi:hypothetical protein